MDPPAPAALALNLPRFFDFSDEAGRAAGVDAAEVSRVLRFVADRVGLRDVLGVKVAEIWRILEQLKSEGQSILVVDKNVEALTRIADRHYIIEKGKVVWTGGSQELKANEDLQHRYLGV